eukprot:1746604-Amphidinium_carterae.2
MPPQAAALLQAASSVELIDLSGVCSVGFHFVPLVPIGAEPLTKLVVATAALHSFLTCPWHSVLPPA